MLICYLFVIISYVVIGKSIHKIPEKLCVNCKYFVIPEKIEYIENLSRCSYINENVEISKITGKKLKTPIYLLPYAHHFRMYMDTNKCGPNGQFYKEIEKEEET